MRKAVERKMVCPLCKGEKTFIFHNKVWSTDNGKVYRCNNCDVAFISPALNDQKGPGFYKNYNMHVKLRGVTIGCSPKELHQKCKNSAQQRYKIVKSYFSKAKTILEIGSSTGAFLRLLEGRECYAVELADGYREFSKQFVKAAYSDISEIPQNRKFDIICMFHVFEHFKNPVKFLKKCKNHLNKTGIILIEVPYVEDPLISIYNCKPFEDFYFQPMHPYVYSLKSLDYVFSRAGLFKKDVIFYQRYGLDNHLAWLSKGKSSGNNHLKDLFGDNLEYKEVLVNIKKTDTLFYIASAQ